VLDETADESLHGSENRPVDHHDRVFLRICGGVIDAEPRWKVEIELIVGSLLRMR
jgi:hypothetical protein